MTAQAERRWEMDALRGLMLVLMAVTHFPTALSDPAGQPFGYVSAAEGFVMLSGTMAGLVYGERARKQGDTAMQDAFFKRALKIYACQAGLLLFAFTVIALVGVIGHEEAVTNLLSFYIERPATAVLSSLLLIYSPALLDILPMYILFMLASPLLLLHGMHRGWGTVLAASVALWLASQFDLGQALYQAVSSVLHLPLRYQDTGAFEIFAWQFLWVLGLWLGATLHGTARLVFPRWMVRTALAVAVLGFIWRHAVGQSPFPGSPGLLPLFDKWHVGPLRLINFFALLLLTMHFGPWLKQHLPRVPALETLGQQSLPVFCAHLVVALSALAFFGAYAPGRPWWIDATILVGGYGLLYATALASRQLDRRTAALRASASRGAGKATARAGAAAGRAARGVTAIPGAMRSRVARARSPRR